MTIRFLPVIIIAAARSGTNMLRDLLTRLPGCGTWPCDEINYIWRYGNRGCPTDEFSLSLATPSVRKYIRSAFKKMSRSQNLSYLIEKTCANSLRVEFVDAILPEAKYVFLVRDGRDVVLSAMKRWTAPLDIRYVLRKAPFVPLQDVPYYAFKYFLNHLHRLRSNERRLSSWGPKFEGMEEMLPCRSLAEICAMQWNRCVEKSENHLRKIKPHKVHRLRYEDFVTHPANELRALAGFLDINLPEGDIRGIVQSVSSNSIGKWEKGLDSKTMESLEPFIEIPMKRYGYY